MLGIAACTPPALRTVPRVVDGRVEHGPFVSPYAYEWFIEGEASASKGRHDDAAMAFESAAAAPSDDELLMTRLAEEYELSGAARRADRTLSVARRSYPESPRVALAEGRLAQHRGQESEAIAAFTRARELAPSWDAPVIAMSELLFATGHGERAIAILLEFARSSLDGRSERARQALLALARRTGDAETLEQALALGPNSKRADRARTAATFALESGQPALAARILRPALDSPDNIALWLRALIESGDEEGAAAFLQSAESEGLGGSAERVDLLLEIGEVQEALDLLDALEPSAKAGYARGRALLQRGDFLKAAAVLAEVPLGTADFEGSRIALAQCSMSQGRSGAAAETLSQAPHGSLAVREALGRVYLEEGALRAGLRLFDPKQDGERAALAALFERAGRFEEAAAYYAAVKASATDEPRLFARASAEQLVSRGNRRAAIAVLEQWSRRAPDDLHARVRLVELLVANDQTADAQAEGRRALGLVDQSLLRAHLIGVLESTPDAP